MFDTMSTITRKHSWNRKLQTLCIFGLFQHFKSASHTLQELTSSVVHQLRFLQFIVINDGKDNSRFALDNYCSCRKKPTFSLCSVSELFRIFQYFFFTFFFSRKTPRTEHTCVYTNERCRWHTRVERGLHISSRRIYKRGKPTIQ